MQGTTDLLTDQLRAALGRGARLTPRGAGRWWPDLPAGAEPLALAGEGRITRLDAADLVASVEAGCTLSSLEQQLASSNVWLALDPPGPGSRTLGGALASGGGGPLAAGFGPPRDQVLGLTLVAGNGQVVKTGGRVVKNVAGFDLAKLVIGGHGAFGILTEVHLRLRARPAADETRAWALGDAPRATRRLLAAGATAAAMEVVSPALARALGLGDAWTLLARALGTDEGVPDELDAASRAVAATATAVRDPWPAWRQVVGDWPCILRVGASPSSWGEAAELLEQLPALLGMSVTVPRGTLRAGFARLAPEQVRALRGRCAERRWPVTLERADAPTRSAVGVFGALEPRVQALAASLRRVFDPSGVFDVPLWANGRMGGRADG